MHPKIVTTRDMHAPTPGSGIVLRNETKNTIDVEFGQASDWQPGTPAGSLRYRLVWAYTASDIDEDFEIAALTGGQVVYDWKSGGELTWNSDLHTTTIEGLEEATQYYVAVAVKDLEGNMAVYSPVGTSTRDETPPTPGTLSILPNDVHSTWVKLAFTEATDNHYSKDTLQYKVTKNSETVHDWAVFTGNYDNGLKVEGLTKGDEYSFTVEVKDSEENTAQYTPVVVTTHESWEPLGQEDFADTADRDIFSLRVISGVLHVAYLDGDEARNQYVTVQKFASDTWSAVGEAGCSKEAALQVDLEADSSGNPHIGYVAYNSNSPVAKVMKYSSSTWSEITGIPAPTGSIFYLDLAMKSDYPVLLSGDNYSESSEQKYALKVFEYNGTTWSEIAGLGNIGSGNNAYVFGSVGYSSCTYVAFNDVSKLGKISVKKYDSSWSYVGNEGFSDDSIAFTQLAFDSTANQYVAYLENTSNGLVVRVKKLNGTAWEDVGTSPINTGGYALGLSFAITGNIPYVAFSDSTKGYKARVMRLKSDGSAWEYVEYVDSGISSIGINNISIALDGSGNPYIAFRKGNKLNVIVYK